MHFDIIWLNGTSSSGKTTLAKELQAARGDRKIGLARYQSARVHVSSEYDVEVDTQELAANHAALKVIAALAKIAPPTAFERLRSKRAVI